MGHRVPVSRLRVVGEGGGKSSRPALTRAAPVIKLRPSLGSLTLLILIFGLPHPAESAGKTQEPARTVVPVGLLLQPCPGRRRGALVAEAFF